MPDFSPTNMVGVPIRVVARLRPPNRAESVGKQDVLIMGKKVVITNPEKENDPGVVYDVDNVYGNDASTKDIFEKSVTPLIAECIEGRNTSIVAFGQSGSGKTFTLEGEKSGASGLIKLAVEKIFASLEAKGEAMAAMRMGTKALEYSFKVSVQFVELYNETIKDLLNPGERNLSVTDNAGLGPVVGGAKFKDVAEAKDLLELFNEGKGNKTAGVTEYGNASDRAACLFTVLINQTVSTGSTEIETTSSMLFADLPGSEKLAQDANSLKMKEGALMNKSIVHFSKLTQQLARMNEENAMDESLLNFYDSNLSALLQESMGGNCMTTVLLTLKNGSSAMSTNTMVYGELFPKIRNYPLLNNSLTKGLLTRYRARMVRSRDHMEHLKADLGSLSHEQQEISLHLMKIHELEGVIIKDNVEKLKLRDEKEALYVRFMELRERYNEMIEKKSSLESELIDSEENRLKISKALIDLQIESNSASEAVENDKFELNNKLIRAEAENMELEMKYQSSEKRARELSDQVEELLTEKKELSSEFVALKTNYVSLNTDFKAEVKKTEELGLELLSLVNARQELLKDKELWGSEQKKAKDMAKSLENKLNDSENKNTILQENVRELQKEKDKVDSLYRRMELELQQKLNTFDHEKLDMEQRMMEYKTRKDNEVMALRKQADLEFRKIKDYF